MTCGPILRMCRHSRSEFGKCVHCSNLRFCFFQDFLRTNSTSKGNIRTKKTKLSNGVLRSGSRGVAAKLCLEEPIWSTSPEEGVTQWWGRSRASMHTCTHTCTHTRAHTHTHTSRTAVQLGYSFPARCRCRVCP